MSPIASTGPYRRSSPVPTRPSSLASATGARPSLTLAGLFVAFVAFAILVLGARVGAQDETGQGPTTVSQLVEARDRPESERIPIVRGLMRNDEPAVTEALLAELRVAREPGYRQTLVQALGAVRREGVLPTLADLLTAEASTPIERSQAARGMAIQGESGVRQLADVARRGDVAIARTYALFGLSGAGTDLAWETLADLVRTGDDAVRRQAIRNLQSAPALASVTQARLAAAKDTDVATASNAVRQLAEQGHERAAELVLEVAGRPTPATGIAAVDLLYAVMAELSPELHPIALELTGAVRRSGLTGNRALEEALPRLGADPAFVDFVRDQLGELSDQGQLRVAIELLTEVPGDEVTAEIAAFAGSGDVDVVTTALRVLARRGDKSALPDLERLMRSRDEGRRIEVLNTIHALRRDEPAWEDELIEMVEKSSRRRKASVEFGQHLSLLADLRSEAGLPFAWEGLGHRDWTVRAAAIDYCRVVRSVDSVPKLFGRLEDESGRLQDDLLDTLRSLTAMRFNAKGSWESWWKEQGGNFELIPADAFANESQSRSRGSEHTVTSYYGIPLVSDRVVFVVDISSSMSAQFGTDRRTRLDEAKRQLRQVVESSPEHFLFNIVTFETGIRAMFDDMQRMAGRRRQEALEQIDELRPIGGTNVHDALERAFEEREVDTIYLMSDGAPSAGPITDPDQLADTVRRWNQTRRIRIHCISIGSESPMLRRIAEESGGEYASSR